MAGNNALPLHGRTIRCILFDCGDTLWTLKDRATQLHLESTSNQRAIAVLRQYLPLQNFPAIDDEKLGDKLRKTISTLTIQARRERPYDEPDFTQSTLAALTQRGFPQLEDEAGEAIFEALRVRSSEGRILFPDALTTLATLQERGFILGIVTNRVYGGPLFVEDMRILGLLDYFDPACMAVSADLAIRKPNPAIFMHALNALQIAPTEAAMVGDSLRADVAGANQLNIYTIWKPSPILIAEVKAALAPDQPYLNSTLFSHAQRQNEQRNRPLPPSAKPDLIIEQLSDLLDIFLQAGVQ